MASTFTLTGTLKGPSNVPLTGVAVNISMGSSPDVSTHTLYAGSAGLATDANGSFTVALITLTGLYYSITVSGVITTPLVFLAPSAGTTQYLDQLTATYPSVDPSTVTGTALTTRAASMTPKLLTGNSNAARSPFAGALMMNRSDLGNTVAIGVDQSRGVVFGYEPSLKKIYNGPYSAVAQGFSQIGTPTGVVPYNDRLCLIRSENAPGHYYTVWFGTDTTSAAVYQLSWDLSTMTAVKTLTPGTSPFGCTIASLADGTAVLVGEYGDPLVTGTPTAHIWRSTDFGVTWTATYTSTAIRHIHCVAFDPYNSGHAYATTGDGDTPAKLLWSTNNGGGWSEVSGFGHAYFQGVQISFSTDYIWLAGDGDGVSAVIVDRVAGSPGTPKHAAKNSHFEIAVPGGAPGDMFYSQAFYGAYDTTNNRYYFVTSASGDPNINNFGNRHGVFYIDKPGGDVRLLTPLGNDFIPGAVRFYDNGARHILYAGNLELDITDHIGTSTLPTSAVTVTASPWTYTNTDQSEEALYIKGGTVSAVTKNSLAIFAQSNVTVFLKPGEAVTVTYSAAPTAFKDVK